MLSTPPLKISFTSNFKPNIAFGLNIVRCKPSLLTFHSRIHFTRFLSSILTDYASVFSSFPSRYIILGDFNYTYSNLQYLGDHFVNGITTPGANPSVTSQRGSSQSCIDFIFLPSYMKDSPGSTATRLPVALTSVSQCFSSCQDDGVR
ncbi:hypothetical protein FB192DRAFT_1379692 [Mucor lusitanicus]|uniref:Endonuclease/exonuclease/phosphatase domain-containing protein n=1 Tax=Mucor circinelloides f. lusitanicus TaxID=29924 RepID=A0A8H4F2P4_MUCCL|nr:hypothetical protein FB192DRAFT_1379692 [Mucor lusitanicus]